MTMDRNTERGRLRLKLRDGAEFEAEGSLDFIATERQRFLEARLSQQPENAATGHAEAGIHPGKELWHKFAQIRGDITILNARAPSTTAEDAAMLIIAAAKALGGISQYSALNLSKSLKLAGYHKERLDRLLLPHTKAGRVLPMGTKRNRSYQLTPKGQISASLALAKLAKDTGQD